jgi:hypothetical protein
MPTVPYDAVPSVGAEPLPGRPYPHVDTDVSAQNFGSGLAAGIEDVGGAGAQAEAKIKEQNDHLRVIDANTQLEAATNTMQYGAQQPDGTRTGGAFSLHGAAALNLPATLMPEYEKAAAQINSTLTPDQQQIFAQHIANNRQQLNLQLNRHEYEESNRLATETFTNSVAQSVENASVGWRDPMALGKARLDIKGAMDIQADRQGWSADQKSVETNKALAEMHFNVVDRMLSDGQSGAALNYFKSVRDTQELTGLQAHQLGATIDASIREHAADNQNAVATKIRDVQTAAVNGLNIPPSSMPARADVIAAFPQDGAARYDAMQKDIRLGADMKNLAGMSPADIAAHVESYKPTDVAGAADQYNRYGEIGQAAQRVLAARAQDPRQYQIDNKLGSQPLNFGDMGQLTTELKSRLASMPADSARLGGYVPPLSRSESAQLSQSLTSMAPDKRFAALKGLSQGIGDDRGFQEVMRQVLPGSPVTAIVGAQTSNTNPRVPPVWMDHNFLPKDQDQIRILAGEQLINPQGGEKGGEKKGFPLPTDTGAAGLRAQFADKTGDLFRSRPQLADAYFTAFKGAYAQLLSEKGDYSGNGNTTLRNQAYNMVIGNTQSIGGKTTAVPPGMDPSRFETIVNSAVAAVPGVPPDFQKKIAGYQLLEQGEVGSGRYKLANGNGIMTNPNGKGDLIIDLKSQFLTSRGARPGELDQARMDRERTATGSSQEPVRPADSIGGAPKVAREDLGVHIEKPPATPDEHAGKGGKAHPSQGPSTQ